MVDNQPDLRTYINRYSSQKVSGTSLDAADETSLSALMRDADLVVEALPGSFALPLGRLAAECGVSLVSSMYYLNPGEQDQGKIESMKHPLKYKFSWSTLGVMRSYRRPARIISKGQAITIDATRVFEPGIYHTLGVEGIGSPMECYPNGDSMHYAELFGIRNSVKEMGRYTCRLPGHCAFWDTAVKCGFLDEGPLHVGDVAISPLEFTAALLSSKKQFHYADDEEDMVFLRVDARGTRDGKRTRVVYQLIDTRDFETGFTSMQRTVGFTMSLGARLILEGKLKKPGLLTPLDVPYESVIPNLEGHNIRVTRKEIPWN